MITFAGRKVSANEYAKLNIADQLINMLWEERLGYELDSLTAMEKAAILDQLDKRTQTALNALGIDKLCKKLDLWQ